MPTLWSRLTGKKRCAYGCINNAAEYEHVPTGAETIAWDIPTPLCWQHYEWIEKFIALRNRIAVDSRLKTQRGMLWERAKKLWREAAADYVALVIAVEGQTPEFARPPEFETVHRIVPKVSEPVKQWVTTHVGMTDQPRVPTQVRASVQSKPHPVEGFVVEVEVTGFLGWPVKCGVADPDTPTRLGSHAILEPWKQSVSRVHFDREAIWRGTRRGFTPREMPEPFAVIVVGKTIDSFVECCRVDIPGLLVVQGRCPSRNSMVVTARRDTPEVPESVTVQIEGRFARSGETFSRSVALSLENVSSTGAEIKLPGRIDEDTVELTAVTDWPQEFTKTIFSRTWS